MPMQTGRNCIVKVYDERERERERESTTLHCEGAWIRTKKKSREGDQCTKDMSILPPVLK